MTKIQGHRTDESPRGQAVPEEAGHDPATQQDAPVRERFCTPAAPTASTGARATRSGGQQPCAGRKKSGKPCGLINTRRTVEGGYRCRHHRKGLTVVGADPVDTPPSTKFRSKADAEKFTSWVLAMGARGRLNGSQVNALMKAVGLWEKVQRRLENDMVEEMRTFRKALGKIKEAYEAALRDIWDDDQDRAERIADRLTERVAPHQAVIDATRELAAARRDADEGANAA